jgi:hypothetical protein
MGATEGQKLAGADTDVQLLSGGRIVAEMLKQESINRISGSAVN